MNDNLIDANTIQQVGYQISPTSKALDPFQLKAFKEIITDITKQELEARTVQSNVDKIKCLSDMYNKECYEDNKDEIFKLIKGLL